MWCNDEAGPGWKKQLPAALPLGPVRRAHYIDRENERTGERRRCSWPGERPRGRPGAAPRPHKTGRLQRATRRASRRWLGAFPGRRFILIECLSVSRSYRHRLIGCRLRDVIVIGWLLRALHRYRHNGILFGNRFGDSSRSDRPDPPTPPPPTGVCARQRGWRSLCFKINTTFVSSNCVFHGQTAGQFRQLPGCSCFVGSVVVFPIINCKIRFCSVIGCLR